MFSSNRKREVFLITHCTNLPECKTLAYGKVGGVTSTYTGSFFLQRSSLISCSIYCERVCCASWARIIAAALITGSIRKVFNVFWILSVIMEDTAELLHPQLVEINESMKIGIILALRSATKEH